MNKKIVAYYSILIGIAVISTWIMILHNQEIPEGRIEMSYHLVSEFIMAFLCITSGIMMIFNYKKAKYFNVLSHGMVIYSMLNAAGYYGENSNKIMMVFFSILCIFSSLIIYFNLRTNQ